MGYDEIIAIVNSTAIILLLLMAIMLWCSTEFRGENAYAAAIIVLTTIPVYSYNLCRSEEWYEVAVWLAPLSYSVNTMLMPLLWLFAYRNFNPSFKFKKSGLLHFLPAAVCLALFLGDFFSQPLESRFDFMIYENSGDDTWLGDVNSAIVFSQMFVYFTLIFIYLHRAKRLIGENFSEADWIYKMWIPKFIMLFAGLFLVVFVCYVIWPRTDAWLIQILNVIAMWYLVFNTMKGVKATKDQTLSIEGIKSEQDDSADNNFSADISDLRVTSEAVRDYLRTSQAYLNPNLTLHDVATAMEISPKKLSKAINTVLNMNFFELVNQFRVEKAKESLPDYKRKNLTLDSIAAQCGFNSRFTFSNTFKKFVGVTTTEWLSSN